MNNNLSKILFSFNEKINKRKTITILKEYKMHEKKTIDFYENTQLDKLKRLLNYCKINNDFYKNRIKEINVDEIKDFHCLDYIPFLNKDDIIENKDNIISRMNNKVKLIPNSTSGSSGKKINFYWDSSLIAINSANTIRCKNWIGWEYGQKKALLWGAPFEITINDSIRKKIKNYFSNTLFLPSFNLSEDKMRQYIVEIRKFKPKLIVGYSSAIYVLSKYIEKNNISLQIPLILASGEVLLSDNKLLIEDSFNGKVFERYGCREFGLVAHECMHQCGLHYAMEHLIIELIPIKNTQIKEIVITDLDNFIYPFIRYKIGDFIEGDLVKNRCECGLSEARLPNVKGRVFDIVVTKDGKYFTGTFWTILMRSFEGIRQFLVHQLSYYNIHISLSLEEGKNKEFIIMELKERIYKYLPKDIEIVFEIQEKINPTSSGKSIFIKSDVWQV